MATAQSALPRHDYYQTPTEIILALYLKGYASEAIKDKVGISFEDQSISIELPPLADGDEQKVIKLEPLFARIQPDKCTSRILSSKIELKLAKVDGTQWPTLLSQRSPAPPSHIAPTSSATSNAPPPSAAGTADPASSHSTSQPKSVPVEQPGPVEEEQKRTVESPPIQTHPAAGSGSAAASTSAPGRTSGASGKKTKNWDRLVEDELQEKEEDNKDPNAGGDAALQKFFAQIYGNADPDTRRAMIKSFTESGGTTLSTDWSTIGTEKTPIRPPDGMEAKKY